jgi:hypothetical protein
MATKKPEKIDLKAKVTVLGTGKHEAFKKGKTYQVHPLLAETLVKAGRVTIKD